MLAFVHLFIKRRKINCSRENNCLILSELVFEQHGDDNVRHCSNMSSSDFECSEVTKEESHKVEDVVYPSHVIVLLQ